MSLEVININNGVKR